MNKFISYDNPALASEIDKNFFLTNLNILKAKLFLSIPKQRIPYINYFKKIEEQEEFKFLFEKMRRFLKISNREFNYYKNFLLEQFKDKEKLRKYFKFFAIEKRYYEKYELEFIIKNKVKSLLEY